MISMTSNIGEVAGRLKAKFESAMKGGVSYDKGLRAACASLVGDIKVRIHQDGLNYDGSKIGTYSNPYMRLRAANNRTEGTDIIISLTTNLENGFTIVVNAAGVYGVGWVDEGAEKVIKEREAQKKQGSISFNGKNITIKKPKKMKPKKASKVRRSIGNSTKFLYIDENYPKVYKASEKEKERSLAAYNEVINNLFK